LRTDDPFDAGLTESEKLEQQERARAASWARMTEQDVRAKLRALEGHPFRASLGRILATAIRRNCRQHLHLLPAEWIEQRPRAVNDNRQGGTAA
jgi:hypothetical protein